MSCWPRHRFEVSCLNLHADVLGTSHIGHYRVTVDQHVTCSHAGSDGDQRILRQACACLQNKVSVIVVIIRNALVLLCFTLHNHVLYLFISKYLRTHAMLATSVIGTLLHISILPYIPKYVLLY